jgi:hypothetical protein
MKMNENSKEQRARSKEPRIQSQETSNQKPAWPAGRQEQRKNDEWPTSIPYNHPLNFPVLHIVNQVKNKMSLQIYIPAYLSITTEFILILTRPLKSKIMKKLILFLCLMPVMAFMQNYQPINHDAVSYFEPEEEFTIPVWFKGGWSQKHIRCLSIIGIYPNPAKNSISITIPSNSKINNVTLYTQAGLKIFSDIAPFDLIDFSNLEAGLYFAEIKTSEGIVRKKIIVQ